MIHAKKIHSVFFFLFTTIINCVFVPLYTDFEVNIAFPRPYHSQGIKVYQAGEIIHTDVSDHTISFFIKDMNRTKEFHILVVKPCDLSYVFNENAKNTIQYRVVNPERSYKFYKISFSSTSQNWNIEDKNLKENGKIPDQTVIIFYNPDYIESFCCSKENPVPTLLISDTIFTLSGGNDALCYEEIRYLLDTLHLDPLQQKISYKITLANNLCKQIIGI
jgi:hypothetical protein